MAGSFFLFMKYFLIGFFMTCFGEDVVRWVRKKLRCRQK